MRKILYLIICIFCLNDISTAQIEMQVSDIFNTKRKQNDYIVSSKVDRYGNMILAGNTEVNDFQDKDYVDRDYLLMKYDLNGKLLWSRTYDGFSRLDTLRSMCLDDQGNIYVTGASLGNDFRLNALTIKYSKDGEILWVVRDKDVVNSSSAGIDIAVDKDQNAYVTGWCDENDIYDCMLIKYNSRGKILWKKKTNGSANSNDEGFAIDVSQNGKYIFMGGVLSETQGYHNYFFSKYDSDGSLKWLTTYDGTGNARDYVTDIVCDVNGNVYGTGISQGDGTEFDITTLKLSNSGSILWIKRYNGPGDGDDWANIIRLDKDNNVYVAGGIEEVTFHDSSDLKFRNDAALIKYNSDGFFQWIGLYQGPNHFHDCIQWMDFDSEGNIYTAGRTCKNGYSASDDIHTMKFRKDGTREWVKIYDGIENNADYGSNIIYNNFSKNIFTIGHTYSIQTGFDVVLIKYNEKFQVRDLINTGTGTMLSNYPNPFNPVTQIQYTIPKDDFVKLNIYDISGRLVKNLFEGNKPAGNYQINFDGSNLSSGVYFYTLQTSSEIITNKLILNK